MLVSKSKGTVLKQYKNTRLVKSLPFHCALEGDIITAPYVDIVKRMYALRLKGYGAPKIAAILNDEFNAPKSIRSGEFSSHFIRRTLKSRANLGELKIKGQQAVTDYFPPAIDSDIFDKVNNTRFFKTGVIAKNGTTNVLKTVAHCSACDNGVVVKVSNSRYRALNCVKRGKGCQVQRSLRVYDVLPGVLNDMLHNEYVSQTFKDSQVAKDKVSAFEAEMVLLENKIKSSQSAKVKVLLAEEVEMLQKRIGFHANLAVGKFNHILESFDLDTLAGRETLGVLLDFIYDSIRLDFDNARILVTRRHDGLTQTLNCDDIDPKVWQVKGLSSLLFKNSSSVPETFSDKNK